MIAFSVGGNQTRFQPLTLGDSVALAGRTYRRQPSGRYARESGPELAHEGAVTDHTPPSAPVKPKGAERDLQRAAEQWLSLHGYIRLTPDLARAYAGSGHIGWYGHWPRARGNPLMPDIMVWASDMRRCLAIELKVRSEYQPGQREMIAHGAWAECRTLEQVMAAVTAWREAQTERREV
jgi:hypothetical protein